MDLINTVFVNCLFDNERILKAPFVIKKVYDLDFNLNNQNFTVNFLREIKKKTPDLSLHKGTLVHNTCNIYGE